MAMSIRDLNKRLGIRTRRGARVESGRHLGTKTSEAEAQRWLRDQEISARATGWKPESELHAEQETRELRRRETRLRESLFRSGLSQVIADVVPLVEPRLDVVVVA